MKKNIEIVEIDQDISKTSRKISYLENHIKTMHDTVRGLKVDLTNLVFKKEKIIRKQAWRKNIME
jgi:hypothetical protein